MDNTEATLRKYLFTPCETEADLHRWVLLYLGLDLPNCTVDPESNSNPTALLWEIYSHARKGTEDFQSCLGYAARDSFKTLSAAILEMLSLFHLERDVAHMAAILSQAANSQKYVKRFASRPIIRDFIKKTSEKRLEVTRYESVEGIILSPREWKLLSQVEQEHYTEKTNYIQIVVATAQGANSEHVPLLVMDELDLAPPGPVEEAQMIPTQTRDGKPPITFMTSTRKYSIGLVQKEIDKAEQDASYKLGIRHWNLLDVTKSCPASRHRPDLPKLPILASKEYLHACSEEEFKSVPEDRKATYQKSEGYAGCLQNCRLYAQCEGRLATDQKSQSPLLKSIAHVQGMFRKVTLETAKAQLLCWKPSSEGKIYRYLSRSVHSKTAAEMAEMITGEPYPPEFSKQELIRLMMSREMSFFAGMDHGYTHMFAVVVGALDGNRMFILDVIAEAELEISQKIDRCTERFKMLGFSPIIFPDPEDPSTNKTLSKLFSIRSFVKGAGSVLEGIQTIRMKLLPTMGRPPELFFLKDDIGVELLVTQMLNYGWKIDAAGNPTKDPIKSDDDLCDAIRYLIMNVFTRRGQLLVPTNGIGPQDVSPAAQQLQNQQQWSQQIKNKINELTGDAEGADSKPIVSGRFYFGS